MPARVTKPVSFIKMEISPDNDTIVYLRGVPFGSPDHRDLQGEFFDAQTDFGDTKNVTTVHAYFDHGMDQYILTDQIMRVDKNISYNEAWKLAGEIGFGQKHIGFAEKFDEDAEGLIYKLTVDRRHRYNDMLREMLEEKMLGASSGTGFKELDPNVPGRIALWHVSDMSLTPTSASPDAQVILVKSSLEHIMAAKTKQQGAVETPVPPVAETPAETPPTAPPAENELVKAVDAIFADEPEAAETADEQNGSSEGDLRSLLNTVLSRLDTMQKSINERQDATDTRIGEIREVIPALATHMVNALKGKETPEPQKTKAAANTTPTQRPGFGQFPPTAPGGPK